MKTICVTTCDNVIEAYAIKDKLYNEGIECMLTNENFTSLMPFMNNMLGSGIQILVFESDYEKALQIIQES